MMNDFTKEELEEIYADMVLTMEDFNASHLIDHRPLMVKIKLMIKNYKDD